MDPEFLPSLSSSRKSHKISNIFIIMSTCRLVEALGSGVKYYMTVEWRRLVGQDQKTSWFQLLCLSVQKKLAQHCLKLLDCIAHIAKYHKYQVCKYASMPVCKYASIKYTYYAWDRIADMALLFKTWSFVNSVNSGADGQGWAAQGWCSNIWIVDVYILNE